MKKLPFILMFLLTAAVLFPACEVENCPPNALSFAHFTLVDQHGNNIKILTPLTVTGTTKANVIVYDTLPDGNIQERVIYDSLLCDTIINKENNAGSFSLPLSYNAYTDFIISYDDLIHDTLHIEHRNIPYFTNLDCGTMMFYEIMKVSSTRHELDSLAITNPNIDNNEKENFKIYFTVDDNAAE